MANKDNSLLQIARDTMAKKRGAQKLEVIIKEVFQQKGIPASKAAEYKAQFILDFMGSGYFVYCGEGKWNLKERETISVLDHDGGIEYVGMYDEDVERNELKDDLYDDSINAEKAFNADDEEDEENEEEDVEDELMRELGGGDVGVVSTYEINEDSDGEENEE